MSRRLILASGSSRRKEILKDLGLNFEIIISDFDEWLDDDLPVNEVAVSLAYGKARAVAEKYPEAIVIGADTIVAVAGKQLAKASNIDEALEMWRLVTSEPNEVVTGVVVLCLSENYEYKTYDMATVTWKPFDERAIRGYLDQNTYQDKAGAYGVQDCPELIDGIDGDMKTVVGLPTNALLKPLADLGAL